MSADSRLIYEIADLTLHSLNGTLDEKGLAKLEKVLRTNPKAVEYYQEIVWTHVGMKSMEGISGLKQSDDKACLDQDLWQAMLQAERTAPEVKVQSKKQKAPVQEVSVHKIAKKKQIGRLNWVSLVTSMAAMVLLLLFIKFAPPKTSVEVATLIDSISAEWGTYSAVQSGERFSSGKQEYVLSNGLVKLAFDSKATSVIEAPAKFKVLGENKICLDYGKMYSVVPPEATGFSVHTNGVEIVDLGTEFGVQSNQGGSTELYVFKGETELTAGGLFKKKSVRVSSGGAKKVHADSQSFADISFDDAEFVHQINSEKNLVWRGSKIINLADIVGGGNGFGTGERGFGVDPATGTIVQMSEANREADNTYHPVKASSFIDGVFVPNGSTQQVVSSEGGVFAECPATKGCYYLEAINTPAQVMGIGLTMGGTEYIEGGMPCLFMHANLGITYDLKEIRAQLHNAELSCFQTTLGIDSQAWVPCNADFWILVDGVVKYKKINATQGFIDFVDIKLAEEDRFLTLVTTDGQDPEQRVISNVELKSIHSDWCIFGNPTLILE